MNRKEKNVYIACSMIKAQQLDFSLLDILIDYTKSQGYNPFVPGKMEDASSKEIYERDMNWLRKSSKIIADVNEPSHGVGMEIMYAYQNDIPVICLLDEKNRPVSRMVEGSPNTVILIYHSKAEIEEKLDQFNLDNTNILLCSRCSEKTIHLVNKCLKC
jgi:nucleoside 2-deoxyribosyltransferase